jgi:hypothetical protein
MCNSAGDPYGYYFGLRRDFYLYPRPLHTNESRPLPGPRLMELVHDATGLLVQLPSTVALSLWRNWPLGFSLFSVSHENLWLDAIFELSWQRHFGHPSHADRLAWHDNASVKLCGDGLFPRLPQEPGFPDLELIPAQGGFPMAYYSKLPDVIRASVAAIDEIIEIGRAADARTIREALTAEERGVVVEHTIDPGFVNRRRIRTIVDATGCALIDRQIGEMPNVMDWEREVRIDHIYSGVMLALCKTIGAKSLEEIVATRKGTLFCSTVRLSPCPNLYEVERAISVWMPSGKRDVRVEFHYTTDHVASTTLRDRLRQGALVSIIGEVQSFKREVAIFDPLVMGLPCLTTTDPKWKNHAMWWSYEFFENVIEDFDEFGKVRNFPKPKDCLPMKAVSEASFKACLAEIIGGTPAKDWGGETSDFFTPHLHLNGNRVRGAFLLKGPARFAPMTLDSLGKRNNQILRLAQEPADVLFVQHCHEITPDVRQTLRVFAVQPSRPRRYCLIDGIDSLWLLQAYGLYEKAVALP